MSDSLYKTDRQTRTKSTKNTAASGNHLLNFSYERYQPPPHAQTSNRRRTKKNIVPYSKERYVQANFHFIVSEDGDYRENLADPDLLVEWKDVEQVTFQSHTSFDCPICLQPPIAAKISKCGHVFCWSCLIRHISYGSSNGRVGKCPICFEYIHLKDVKSVVIDYAQKFEQGENIKFVLVKRSKSSTIPLPRSSWRSKTEIHPELKDESTLFARFRITSDISDIIAREQLELDLSAKEADSEQDLDSLSFITLAQDALSQRKQDCLQKLVAVEKEKEYSQNNSRKELSQSGSKTRSRSNSLENSKEIPVNIVPNDSLRSSQNKDTQFSGWHNAFRNIDSALRKEISEDLHAFSEDEEEEYHSSVFEEDDSEYENSQNSQPSSQNNQPSDEEEEFSKQNSEEESLPTLLSTSPISGENSLKLSGNKSQKSVNIQQALQAVEKGMEDEQFYYFYQAVDGQQSILHPLDCQILLREFGSIENLPDEIEGKILESEIFSQTELLRRRNKALGHLPINSSYELVEIDLRQIVSRESLKPFYDEIFKRHRRREAIKRKKEQESRRDEAKAIAKRKGAAFQSHHFPPTSSDVSITVAMRERAHSNGNSIPSSSEFPEPTPASAMIATANPVSASSSSIGGVDEDEELRRAIEASLQDAPTTNNNMNGGNQEAASFDNNNNNNVWGQRKNSSGSLPNNNNNTGSSFADALKSKPKDTFVLSEKNKKKGGKKGGTQYVLMSNNSARRYN